jgi:threonine dehydrogenase-like Zn-dependent dehydrogenase
MMAKLHLGWMVTHRYTLDNYLEAIERASAAGRLDALKVVFDLRRSGDERK